MTAAVLRAAPALLRLTGRRKVSGAGLHLEAVACSHELTRLPCRGYVQADYLTPLLKFCALQLESPLAGVPLIHKHQVTAWLNLGLVHAAR